MVNTSRHAHCQASAGAVTGGLIAGSWGFVLASFTGLNCQADQMPYTDAFIGWLCASPVHHWVFTIPMVLAPALIRGWTADVAIRERRWWPLPLGIVCAFFVPIVLFQVLRT